MTMRPPRPSEVTLLRRLASGPQPLREGPVGRCTKRGWCRSVEDVASGEPRVLFALTEAGWAALMATPGRTGSS
ncbi:hypothetical protein P7D22_00125 [Lichenihabitans sp. Uapishka_5]|uniref:hypothetical protein n=1 Tax=Lichenihabitans sp. Uapishka_5 TaxID=3037302 RepID=UPI0029E7E4DE|nr:hypothetical protein [Lichenihabitans sp. Uapishka_5]MDX7949585.1 hypothetical protein [Lichenihabitans sp. Uapishka_5]